MIHQNRKVKILLIEDNPGDIRLTQEAFKEASINTTSLEVVTDGVEALHYLYQEAPYESASMPDLILLDLNLPKLDGREVLQRIKSDDKLKKIPVIILTTSKAEEDILKSYNLHVNCYITKPIDFDDFFEIVQRIENFWIKTVVLPTMA